MTKTLQNMLLALALLMAGTVYFNQPKAEANSPPENVVFLKNATFTGSATVLSSTYTAPDEGILRIQFQNNSGSANAVNPQIVSDGATQDFGTSTIALGDMAAFTYMVGEGEQINLTFSDDCTGTLKAQFVYEGQ